MVDSVMVRGIETTPARASDPVDAPEPVLGPVARGGDLPMAYAQERVWLMVQLAPDSRSYQMQAAITFRGALDVPALEWALGQVVRRHEAFRTTFHAVDGRPVQRIHPAWAVSLPLADLSTLPPGERDDALRLRLADAFETRIDPSRLPLVRWTLLRLAGDHHVLAHVEHHLIHDGWSFNVFLRDALELYRARLERREPVLPALPVQYADFCAWQRAWMRTAEARAQAGFWAHALAGAPHVLELPTDRPRPPVQRFRGGRLSFRVPAEVQRRLGAVARAEGASLFQAMLAAFAVLMARWSGQDAVTVGTGIAGRRQAETEDVVGMFVNSMALPIDLSGNPAFGGLLARVRETTLEAYERQDLPFDAVVDAVQPERDLSRNPLFQALFSFHDSPAPRMEVPGARVEVDLTPGNGSAKLDLNVIVIPADDGSTVVWEYDADLFDDWTAERMAAQFVHLLGAAADAPEHPALQLPLAGEAERRRVLLGWNDTSRPYPRDACVHELFEAQARRTPLAPAVIGVDETVSYAELNERANRLARVLRRRGVGPEARVGVCVDRGPRLVTALLAVLKAGGAYLPLDAKYPRERLAYMLADGGVALVLAERHLADALPAGAPLLALEAAQDEAAAEDGGDLGAGAGPMSMAYVIYTSGSTGRPKGVMVDHRAIVRLATGADYCALGPGQVVLGFSPVSFDVSTWELWGPLLNGGALAPFPPHTPSLEELGAFIGQRGITAAWLTSGLFHQVVDAAVEGLAGVRTVLAGGDVLSPAHVRRLLEACPGVALVNGYGPTENTTFTTCHRMDDPAAVTDPVSIGRPIAQTRVYVLGPGMEPVPPGVPGELYTGGDGVARGYWSRPALTAGRFIPDPFSADPGARLYRTGDRARWRRNGTLEFLGRLDTMVKVRGFRIEPGEVEAALREHPAIAQAAVIAREDKPGDKQLVAYVVPPAGAAAPGAAALRAHLLERLPAHMVPSAWVALRELPLNPNGKVDRRALPAPGAAAPPANGAEPAGGARTPTERALAEIWAEVLGVPVGVDDDLFVLGAHSLRATQAVTRIRQRLGISLPLRAVFDAPTIAALARHVDALAAAPPPAATNGNRAASPEPSAAHHPPARFSLAALDEQTANGAAAPAIRQNGTHPPAEPPASAERNGSRNGAGAHGELERKIAALWAQALGRERVGMHDNFFDLGGYSLLLMRLHARVHALVPDAGVTVLDLFSHPTVASLCACLRGVTSSVDGAAPTGDAELEQAAPSGVPAVKIVNLAGSVDAEPDVVAAPPADAAGEPAPGRPTLDRPTGREIAIIGMSGRFPGADDVRALWRNLRGGVDSVADLTDADLDRAGVSAELRADPRYVRAEGVLADADRFDRELFGLGAREAALLDPQHRVFLECAWHALEDAGHDPARFSGRIGVFAGAGTGGYLSHLLAHVREGTIDPLELRLANDRDFLPARVAYRLGLEGPAVNVQSACSTSLLAVHLACRALRAGECEMALAGGVMVAVPQGAGYLHRPGGFRSPDGRCRAFDQDAAGLVGGSGAGVVVLRRLQDALADGDAVRAVILGSAVNNDGARRAGFTAPSARGQARVVRDALAAAGVSPATIGYVEAHGTGTELGDPIEVAALAEAYGPRPAGSCALGSVKTNLGHLDAAAGVTGLIKAALSLEHGELVPTLHFQRPNPRIDFGRNPFRVVTQAGPWARGDTPRRAAVSSFGMGGTNAHVVLEEAPDQPPTDAGSEWQLLAISARTPAALDAATARLAAHLREHPGVPLADVAFTLAAGRRELPYRRALVVHHREDAAALLERRAPWRVVDGVAGELAAPVAFLFPGQGTHHAGAARGLYDAEPVFRDEADRCAALLRPHLGVDLRPLLFPAPDEKAAAAARLGETRLAGPAAFTLAWAFARLWASLGVEPESVAGQGAGELAAACVAGVFTLDDAAALVAERARLLHAVPAGSLLAVPLPAERVEPRLADGAALAASLPGASLVAGPEAAIAALRAELAREGLRATVVPGARPPQPAAAEPAVEPFRRRVADVRPRPPGVPLVSSVTGRWLGADEAADAGYWAGQICRPSRFDAQMDALSRVPERLFLEIGAGTALASLARRHPADEGRVAVASLAEMEGAPDSARFLRAAAALWCAGAAVRLPALHGGERRRRVPLPGYPFERRRCWFGGEGEDA